MGEVYKARDTRLDRIVAVKVLPADFAADPDRVRCIEHEARTISKLNHPLCALYDVGQHDRSSFLVMEYLGGESMSEAEKGAPAAGGSAALCDPDCRGARRGPP
jgi:serine/threonine protein kinase